MTADRLDGGLRAFRVRPVVPGRADAPALVLGEPLSLWGGLDPHNGTIVDRFHPRRGAVVTGRVVVMPGGRGSSSTSSVLAEAVRLRTGPAAFVLTQADEILALGALVAEELYGTVTPVVIADAACVEAIVDARPLAIDGSSLVVGPDRAG
jgi:predicted aconitase with swiveling domain